MKFGLAFLIIMTCLIPFIIMAGFGLDWLLDYKRTRTSYSFVSLESEGAVSYRKNLPFGGPPYPRDTFSMQMLTRNLPSDNVSITEGPRSTDKKISTTITTTLEPKSPPPVTPFDEFNDVILKLQTQLIQVDKSRVTSVIVPLASTVALFFTIIVAGEDSKRHLCTAVGLKPENLTVPLEMRSVTTVGIKSLIDTLKPNLMPNDVYGIQVDPVCHIKSEISQAMTTLGVKVNQDAAPRGNVIVELPLFMSLQIRVKDFLNSCTKDFGMKVRMAATAKRGKLPSLDNAEFFELLPSSNHSGIDDDKLIIIRPSSEGKDNIQSMKSKLSQLNFKELSDYIEDAVKISVQLQDTISTRFFSSLFPPAIIDPAAFYANVVLLGNYNDLCDNESNGTRLSVRYYQTTNLQIDSSDAVCPAGTVGGPGRVQIDKGFIMLLLNRKTINFAYIGI